MGKWGRMKVEPEVKDSPDEQWVLVGDVWDVKVVEVKWLNRIWWHKEKGELHVKGKELFDVRMANIVCLLNLYRLEKNLLKSGHIIINIF